MSFDEKLTTGLAVAALPPRKKPFNHPPLKKNVEKRARKYIKKCEEKKNNKDIFVNFEKDLLDHIANRNYDDEFGHSFVEYVLLEEAEFCVLRNDPPFLIDHLVDACMNMHRRLECRARWGATPKHHGLIYRDIIHQAMHDAGNSGALIQYLVAHNRRLPYTNY